MTESIMTDEEKRLAYIDDLRSRLARTSAQSVRRQLRVLISSAERSGSDVVPPYQPWLVEGLKVRDSMNPLPHHPNDKD